MSYIQKSLGADEKLVAVARFHWWYAVQAWAALIFLGVFIIGIWIFFEMMIRKWTTEIGITTHRFIVKTGLFSLHTEEMAIHNIEGVKVSQGFWGRMLGYGTLRIEGTGVDAIVLPPIADPIAFRAAIETAKGIEGGSAKPR
ncbi:MAG TPA: PH domain-containing protein [Rhizomicrobium sp.]|nr:PH domain-containing protein [Rhizomicrobium sp.]